MTKTTGERMAKIETKIEYLTVSVDEIKKDIREHLEWEQKKYGEMHNHFASKWVEKVVYGFVALVLTLVLTALVREVLVTW